MTLDLSLAAQGRPVTLPAVRNWPGTRHVFDEASIWAINAALASGRPLLLRGEPGSGKSQLARAAAVVLERPFLSRVINGRFEPEDLLYRFDAVARLAKAQILLKTPEAQAELDARNFLIPEILWWALDHGSAKKQYLRSADHVGAAATPYDKECGPPLSNDVAAVVLIDEIDKADAEVPNSLLEALATNGFQLPFGGDSVSLKGAPPLIVITTNEDRELPPAFVRRCLVHNMDLPKEDSERRERLRKTVRAHFDKSKVPDALCDRAIDLLEEDRQSARQVDLTPPGQAELIDLLHAVVGLTSDNTAALDALERLRSFAFRKHRAG
jgi:MoxR-like ATPase